MIIYVSKANSHKKLKGELLMKHENRLAMMKTYHIGLTNTLNYA